MERIERKTIDWEKTGFKLQALRNDNLNLRKYCCYQLYYNIANCSGKCDDCIYEMDQKISRLELAKVLNVTDNIISNWESGRSRPEIEDLMFYAEMCKIDLFDILTFV